MTNYASLQRRKAQQAETMLARLRYFVLCVRCTNDEDAGSDACIWMA
jgi:hypothetical protein